MIVFLIAAALCVASGAVGVFLHLLACKSYIQQVDWVRDRSDREEYQSRPDYRYCKFMSRAIWWLP